MVRKPNILIFMTDHQRGDIAPPYNKAYTPNLERLSENSVCFTNAYTVSPHCCPSRASFFTGLYPSKHGVWNNVFVGNALSRSLNKGAKLWSEDLKENGYDLYFTGKWHVCADKSPSDFGFSRYDSIIADGIKQDVTEYDFSAADWSRYFQNTVKKDNLETTEGEISRVGYQSYKLYFETENPIYDEAVMLNTKAQIELFSKTDDNPWCIYTGMIGPHDPYQAPKEFLDMYNIDNIELPKSFYDDMKDKPALYRRTQDNFKNLSEYQAKQAIRHYLAYCTYEDYLFGEILDTLIKTNQIDNTYIFYLSDHGDYMGEHRLFTKGLPCFNSAYHIPLIIGNKNIKNSVCTEYISICDLAPTILELCGINTSRNFAGKSLVPFIRGETSKEWRNELFTQTNGNELYGIQRSVMTKKYKYVYNGFDYDELYDIQNDPEQIINLISNGNTEKYKDIIYDLWKKLWLFALENDDNSVNDYIFTSVAPYGAGIITNIGDE